MPSLGTQAWVDALCAALAASDDQSLRDVELVLQQVVRDTPDGEVVYWISFDRGDVSGALGRSPSADVTFEMDHATATALGRGDLNHQAAFMQGMLTITGNMGKLLKNQQAFKALGPATSSIADD